MQLTVFNGIYVFVNFQISDKQEKVGMVNFNIKATNKITEQKWPEGTTLWHSRQHSKEGGGETFPRHEEGPREDLADK